MSTPYTNVSEEFSGEAHGHARVVVQPPGTRMDRTWYLAATKVVISPCVMDVIVKVRGTPSGQGSLAHRFHTFRPDLPHQRTYLGRS
mmetsp:Transcript_88715/g.170726  ORF Transcript_88715/g.170726 Transcript_88715/m.170726 type:complete len:87 (+) Transcript_88715:925-1185(+)